MRDLIEPALLELLPPLSDFAPPAVIVDKGRHSAPVEGDLQPIPASAASRP
jgi:hypothetical protein